MDLLETLQENAVRVLPFMLIGPLLLLPFVLAEQLRPVHRRPGWRDYGMNILISWTTLFLAIPFGIVVGIASSVLRALLPWQPINFTYSDIAYVPVVGDALQILAMIFLPILIHDIWFYWAHRISHRVLFLWEFHKLHHSDELINCSTAQRNHFLQAAWVALFPAITLGLIFDIPAIEAGESAALSVMVHLLMSNFAHSAVKVQLPWLDKVIVTPQVHRIHHSIESAHYDRNFADAFPLFDIIFGTYHEPTFHEFPETGLGQEYPAPHSLWSAQVGPALSGFGKLLGNRPEPDMRGKTT